MVARFSFMGKKISKGLHNRIFFYNFAMSIMEKLWSQQLARHHKKYVIPCIKLALKVFSFMANIGALCIIVGAVLEFGFVLTERLKDELHLVYFWHGICS